MLTNTDIGHAPLVKRLVRTAVMYTDSDNNVHTPIALADRLVTAIGIYDSVAEPAPSGEDSNAKNRLRTAAAVTQDVAFALVDAVCDLVDRGFSDVEWGLQRMILLEKVLDAKFSANSDGRNANGAYNKLHVLVAKLANRAESAAQAVSRTYRLLIVEFLSVVVHMFKQLLFGYYPGAQK